GKRQIAHPQLAHPSSRGSGSIAIGTGLILAQNRALDQTQSGAPELVWIASPRLGGRQVLPSHRRQGGRHVLSRGVEPDQSQKVFDAINAKNNLVHQRFRGVVMFNAPAWLADVAAKRKPKELVKRMEEINKRQAEIYKMVRPVSRHFELKAAK